MPPLPLQPHHSPASPTAAPPSHPTSDIAHPTFPATHRSPSPFPVPPQVPLSPDDKDRIDTWMDHDARLTEIAHDLHTNVLELAEWSRQPHIRHAFRLIRQIADERTRTLHAEAAHQALQRLNSISTHSRNEETARRAAKNILSWNPERRTFARGPLPNNPSRPPRRRTRRHRFTSLAPLSSPAPSPTVPSPGSPSPSLTVPRPGSPSPSLRVPTPQISTPRTPPAPPLSEPPTRPADAPPIPNPPAPQDQATTPTAHSPHSQPTIPIPLPAPSPLQPRPPPRTPTAAPPPSTHHASNQPPSPIATLRT